MEAFENLGLELGCDEVFVEMLGLIDMMGIAEILVSDVILGSAETARLI